MHGAPVGGPTPLRPRQPALGGDEDARAVAAPRRTRARDQPLVMSGVALVPAVRVCGVEERDARVERSVKHFHRARLVSIALGRQAHAAEADHRWQQRSIIARTMCAKIEIRPAMMMAMRHVLVALSLLATQTAAPLPEPKNW